MSRLCRLRTYKHGEDGQWAYEEIVRLREQVAAQAAVIEALKSALTYVIEDLELRASLKLDEDERDVVDIGNGAYTQAKEALAIPTDSTQILAEVRRAERERCAKVCDRLSRKEKNHAAGYGFGYLTYTADDCAAAIRAME